jgi:hypothetical protein
VLFVVSQPAILTSSAAAGCRRLGGVTAATGLFILAVILSTTSPVAVAQDVQPRAFTPAPVGINALGFSYQYSFGEVLFDKTLPVENVEGDLHGVGLSYSRTINAFGLLGRTDVALPFVAGDWIGDVTIGGTRAEGQTRSASGLADPTMRVVLNLIGAPALGRQEFANYRPNTIVSAILRLKAPLGQYDASRLINLGSNRWAFSPQVAVSHVSGRILVEAHAGVWVFTNNDELLGASTLRQDPLYAVQAHVGYLTRRGFWIAVSSRQSFGGATQIDDGPKTEAESNNRIGVSVSIPFQRRYALKLFVTVPLTTAVGNDYDTFGGVISVVL